LTCVQTNMKTLILLLLLFVSINADAKSPELSDEDLKSVPPKIIRTCCSFGYEVKLVALPFVKFTDITSYSQLGSHQYLGNETEMNGILYTHRGGFIDVAHMRDVADWTAYLYKLIKKVQKENIPFFEMKLGYEGGTKKLKLKIPDGFQDDDAINLAGKIAYDISVWHEIATWYGNSYLPIIKERYSAFSVEDAYSNLLGAHIGMEAIRSNLPYNEAVTQIINQKLLDLKPVNTIEETKSAMNSVKDIWWTDKAYMPSGKVLMKREFRVYGDSLYPRLIPTQVLDDHHALPLFLCTDQGQDLNDFYDLSIKLNLKFPYRRMFVRSNTQGENRLITQRDFQTIISFGTFENRKKYPIDQYQFE
jgi:Protein of unknown function (DUF4056)